MRVGTRFTEAMAGTWRRAGGREHAIRFDLVASTDTLLRPLGTVGGRLVGRIHVAGLARDVPAAGTIELSPVEHRRVRYTLAFTGDDGTAMCLDGWKSIDWRRPLTTWTTLPATITDVAGAVIGTADLRFAWRDLPSLVSSVRPLVHGALPLELHRRRWDGRPGRLEVWYETFTDPGTGTGYWLHHELVAPAAAPARPGSARSSARRASAPFGADSATAEPAGPGRAPSRALDEGLRAGPHVHGWMAVFPPGVAPTLARYGPLPVGAGPSPAGGEVEVSRGVRRGAAGSLRWDLRFTGTAPPVLTFPAAAWRHELLPGAQVVAVPTAVFSGTIETEGRTVDICDAPGASARVYGHGNAERWAWLHADLGGGDLLEVVAASPRRPGLRYLPPVTLVQLRLGGRDWPAKPLLAAARFRCRLDFPRWTVTGIAGDRRLAVDVHVPAERSVAVDYSDPDGAPSTCTNSERADATVVVQRRRGGRWTDERSWELAGTAHAEVGMRP